MTPTQKELLTIFIVVIIVISVGAVGSSLNSTPTKQPSNNAMQNSTNTNSANTNSLGPTPTSTSTPTATQQPTTIPPVDVDSVDGLELTMAIEKTQYVLGEPINITLTIINISNQTINFNHSGQDFDFLVNNDTNNIIYQWSKDRAFAMFIMIMPLKPQENLTGTYTWQQTSNYQPQQETQVSPGTYNIVGETGPTYGLQTPPIQVIIVNSQLSSQEQVRNDVMYYIQSNHHETTQFTKNLVWNGGRTTLPNHVGAETYIYYSQGWNVTINYPVVPNAIYNIVADYSATSIGIPYRIIWKGNWQNEVINETSYVFAQ